MLHRLPSSSSWVHLDGIGLLCTFGQQEVCYRWAQGLFQFAKMAVFIQQATCTPHIASSILKTWKHHPAPQIPEGCGKHWETMVSPTNVWFSTSIVRSVQQPARSAIKCWFQQCQRSKEQEDWLTSLRSFAQWYSQHQYISCGWIYKYVCTCKPTIDINRQYTYYIYICEIYSTCTCNHIYICVY